MREHLLSYLFENASREADIALRYRRRLRWSSWSYAKLARTASQFARELEQRSIGKGDRVMIWGENCPEWVAAVYGSMLRGAVIVPIDEQSTRGFVERVAAQTNPRLLLHGTRVDCGGLGLETIALEDLADTVGVHASELYRITNISRSDVVEVVFTSGTTGEPKGVTLTHDNILANVEAIERVVKRYSRWKFLVHPIRVLCLLPLSHVFGQVMGVFVPPLLQIEVLFQDRLNPAEIVETIKRKRVSVLATVPRILETLKNKVERDAEAEGKLTAFEREASEAATWGALKKWWRFRGVHRMFGLKFWSFVSGGAALAGETEEFWQRLGFVVVQGYGMTETSALVSLNNPFKLRQGSIGEVLAGQEVKIDESGEILVRGKNVSRRPGERSDADGWLRTGDVGYLDETGRLYFKGRKKDVIVTAAGLNVYPEDVESALDRQSGVVQSVVFGLEGQNGEEPVAAIILKAGADAAGIVEAANMLLAPYQQVRRWIVWPEPDFPRTATMKVRRNVVAEIARQKLSAERASPAPARSILDDVLGRVGARRTKGVASGTRLSEDLGLDSLARVELLSAVEDRFKVDLDEQAFTTAETVGDLERLIRAERPSTREDARITFPRWSLSAAVSWLRTGFYYAVTRPVTRLLCRVNVEGLENLLQLDGPVLFASNHITEIDAGLIMSAMPGRFRRRLAIAMDGERLMSYLRPAAGTPLLTRLRGYVLYWLTTALFNVFPLPRRSGFRRSFEYAGEVMDKGYSVLIFPEGEMTKDGKVQKLRPGVRLLANGLETATMPVTISGLYEQIKAGRRFYAPPGSVTITFGKAIPFDRHRDPSAVVQALERTLGKHGEY
jgi:long-chain acyl-CoA synthetase